MSTIEIYGAGLAGLLAACILPNAHVIEAREQSKMGAHRALLRFRSNAVGAALGIDFRKVRVHKGIWHEQRFVNADIFLANTYSLKVIGNLSDRSLWNIDPVDRYVAPETLYEQMVDRCANRITWGMRVSDERGVFHDKVPAISTLPMITWLATLGPDAVKPEFTYAPISVKRWRVRNADVFQTVYFPSRAFNLYRASITGDLLIAEYVGAPDSDHDIDTNLLMAFGLRWDDLEPVDQSTQRFGKIAPIDDAWRRNFIFRLSRDHNIFSLGRFAIWRNILLDDVLHDVSVVKRLINSSSYELQRAAI
jgi:hypothetical protein